MDEKTLARFEAKKIVDGVLHPELGTPCWLWTSVLARSYGILRVGSVLDGTRMLRQAHVLAYEHWVGLVPEGLVLDHLCKTKRCCNPVHLEPVTQAENIRRASVGKTSYQTLKTHCPQGHSYAEYGVTQKNSDGGTSRVCKLCNAAKTKLWRDRKSGKIEEVAMAELRVGEMDEAAKARFDTKYVVADEPHRVLGTRCWLWTAARSDHGYSVFSLDGKTRQGHVVRWEHDHGPVPDGLELDHKCRMVSCVNPEHMEAVTHEENIRRSQKGDRGANNAQKTHCPKGHEYTPENTLFGKTPKGGTKRDCKACTSARKKARRASGVEVVKKGPVQEKATHCQRGHEFTPENTILTKNGEEERRQCRVCKREATNAYRAKKAAERLASEGEAGVGSPPRVEGSEED